MEIQELHNIIPEEVCKKLINTFKDSVTPAEIINDHGAAELSKKRVAYNHFFNSSDFKDILPLEKFICELTKLPSQNLEQFCLIKYTPGGEYTEHYDASELINPLFANRTPPAPRSYSFLFYLNDNYEGGETNFSNLNKKILPKTGKGIFWKNYKQNGELEKDSIHSGLPVTKGTKWILTCWARDPDLLAHFTNKNNFDLEINSIYEPLNTENYGYSFLKVPEKILEEIKPQINRLEQNFNLGERENFNLIGEIKNEYTFNLSPLVEQFLSKALNDFEVKSNYFHSRFNFNVPVQLRNHANWINYQKKHEYNPPHNHSGIYSWVIFYQIPYYLSDELKFGKSDLTIQNPQNFKNGNFSFITGDYMPKTKQHEITHVPILNKYIDKTYEGYMVIFPSNLTHTVYPFYSSDDFRITIAGNSSPFITEMY